MIPASTINRLLERATMLAHNPYHELAILRGALRRLADGFNLDIALLQAQHDFDGNKLNNDKTKKGIVKDRAPQTAGFFRQCQTWYYRLFR